MQSQLVLNLLQSRKKMLQRQPQYSCQENFLMFAKLLLKSFIYSLTEILSFPDPIFKKIYEEYQIEGIICYHILSDTDSTSLQFVILSDPANSFPEFNIRDIFEVIVKNRNIQI